jgi:translation initiation factor IF-1
MFVLIQLEGVMTRALGYRTMEIEYENNTVVKGVLCGWMKKRKIKAMKGDRIQVRVSTYDMIHHMD